LGGVKSEETEIKINYMKSYLFSVEEKIERGRGREREIEKHRSS